MAQVDSHLSTGLPGLDHVLRGLIPGDNIVWQISAIEDYLPFVKPYCQEARDKGRKLIYFRFARHAPLLDADDGAEVHELDPEGGFESFISEIHAVIEKTGRGGYYVFDCLSDLAADWYSDQMLGNFFMLTCPYLFDIEAIAFFAIFRNRHSSHAVGPISETTQIFLDVYRHKGRLYIHPVKVQQRYSPTMYMLHVWQDDQFPPVTESAITSEILTSVPWLRMGSASYHLGVWNRTILEAEEVLEEHRNGQCPPARAQEYFHRLLRMAISREDRVLGLVEKYLGLAEVVNITKRMIGTGLIGGKSVGMLLARAVLQQGDARWRERLEPHDSFYIGSDVFYTFLVRNGIWWVRQQQRDKANFLVGAEKARQRMLMGNFPEYTVRQFEMMLDYFGQSPIIVRSSSLLEDNFGNSFAGKYESIFCANQGSRHKRLEDFISAVRTIYASTMSEKALTYRAQRGILDRDEQMALLVQRVSGKMYSHLFFPQIAGVGFSFNPYVWNQQIDPSAGMLRLVFGLGTRAVDRSDDDYTRVVALNEPQRRPEANFDEVRQYSQRRVDVLDLEANQLLSESFAEVIKRSPDLPIEVFASRDEAMEARAVERGVKDVFPWVLTFDNLFTKTDFVADTQLMLASLQTAYDYPVDVEFTANFFNDGSYKINLVQCRPFQVKGGGVAIETPDIRRKDMILEAHGAVIGQSRSMAIQRLIYVVPAVYGAMPISDRHNLARVIGRLTHVDGAEPPTIMLLGPGRWGTTTPSLGVPVTFADINTVSVLCEIVAMREDLIPDVSLGTHFFNELVEMDMLYLALFPTRQDNFLNKDFFEQAPNKLAQLLPDAASWSHAIRVIDSCDLPAAEAIRLNANALDQKVITWVQAKE
ncbi:MAG: PEP/pyruvate-binding domain-containing protein [Phycisphaerae bacterium]|jgi:hypothetical protein